MTTRVAVAAHAKLNLWLRVTGREESGYHSIETLFHKIELHDDVVVSLAPEDRRTIHCSENVGPDRDNLAYRAAELYCAATGWHTGFHIEIIKRIPAAGGLGGGSADAAATLLALNAMSPSICDERHLSALGAQLGADIPFLISAAPAALAWGRGDRMLELAALPQKHVALVVPAFGISTAEAYRTIPAKSVRSGEHLSAADLSGWARVVRRAGNDLAASSVVESHGQIAAAVATLHSSGAMMAGMTGSGSVVFGIFDTEPDVGALERGTGGRIMVTRTSVNVEGPTRLD